MIEKPTPMRKPFPALDCKEAVTKLTGYMKRKKEEHKHSKMRETPCDDYIPSGSRPGYCQGCGHAESAHEENQKPIKQMKQKVITSGGVSRIASADSLKAKLDPGFYILEMNMQGFYLTLADTFELPKKVYGTAHERAERILKTYRGRGNKSMGVMCSGRPGTGKTILSKVTANKACQEGMPVIIIRQGYFGPPMSSFLESLPNRCLMFVDEIEKVYDSEEARNWLLSVLDGTVISSHLWLSTCNNPDIGQAFESRPGRIRYHYRFANMEKELINGMISENIRNTGMRKAVFDVAEKIQNLTPDVLYSVIEECLIHNEVPADFMEFLNVDTSIPSHLKAQGFVMSYPSSPQNMARVERLKEGSVDDKSFARYADQNGLSAALSCYPDEYKRGFKKALVAVKSPWCDTPISFNRDGKLEVCEYFELEGKKVEINWDAGDIQKTEFQNGAFTIHGPEKGEVLYFKPMSYVKRNGVMEI